MHRHTFDTNKTKLLAPEQHRRYGEYKDELSRDSDEDIAPYTAGRSNRFQFTATERAKLRREGKEGARSLKSWRAGILSSEDSSDDELLGACGGTTRLNRRKVFSSDDDLDLSEDYSFSKGKRRDEAEKERGLRKKSQVGDRYRYKYISIYIQREI